MTYLITQTFLLLLLAGLLGLVLGWYLTRIAAQATRATLQTRLRNAESDARELRGELDVAVTARGQSEAERQGLADSLAALEQVEPAAGGDAAEVASLRGELEGCRKALAAAQGAVSPETTPKPQPAPAEVTAAPAMAMRAPARSADGAEADDLQLIKGIGPKIAAILSELGIVRFEQIAAWTPENVAWVNDHLRFKGRIEREEWIPQARALMAARDA